LNMQSPTPIESNDLDSLLCAYAAGALGPALHALVAAHLELVPDNRAFVAMFEAECGAMLSTVAPAPIPSRDARLAAIFAGSPAFASIDRARPSEFDVIDPDPRALIRFFGAPIDALPCRRLLPGVKEFRLDCGDGERAILYRVKPGRKLPEHTHDGEEVTLVLRGAFRDLQGRFGRGDIVIADHAVDHAPVAEPEEECICFTVIDAPLRLTGRFGRLLNPFLAH